MISFALISLIAGLGYALPQDNCQTETTEVIIPTRTATYTSTAVVTEYPTTAKNLGTFTQWSTISSTKTLQTLTSYASTCHHTDIISIPFATETVYRNGTGQAAISGPSSTAAYSKRALGLAPRDACTVTVTTTTTYGQTQTYVPAEKTSTYYDYTAFTQATVTSTTSGGKAWEIATAYETTPTKCGDVTVTPTLLTTTVTLDPRCSPSAMTSAYNGYGIDGLSDTPTSGATYETNTTDSSACCQLCAEAQDCAASAWDIRTGACRLEFPVDYNSGEMNCGEGLLGYYDAGPINPMSPGAGWYVAQICGNAQFGSAKPDDGT